MFLQPIDLDQCETLFPYIIEIYGKGNLIRQVDAFNDYLETHTVPLSDIDRIMYVLFKKYGIKKLHRPLLAAFSAVSGSHILPSPMIAQNIARILLLENNLKILKDHGIPSSCYSSMIQDAEGFHRLLGETEVQVSCIQCGGHLDPHTKTDNDSDTDYDVHWEKAGYTIKGDVKTVDNWVSRDQGANPISIIETLLENDIGYQIKIKMKENLIPFKKDYDFAEEVLDLYNQAMQEESSDQIQVSISGTWNIAQWKTDKDKRFVEHLTVQTEIPGRRLIGVIDPFVDDTQDAKAICNNIESAAIQIPKQIDPQSLNIVFLVSSVHEVVYIVDGVLNGCKGLFSRGYAPAHIEGVVFLGISYPDDQHDLTKLRVSRTAKIFYKSTASEKSAASIMESLVKHMRDKSRECYNLAP